MIVLLYYLAPAILCGVVIVAIAKAISTALNDPANDTPDT
jgi:hypothetical protein